MKTSRIAVSVIFIALMLIGWMGYIKGVADAKSNYNNFLSEARTLYEQKLYVKSLQNYNNALEIKSSEDVWAELVNVNKLAYDESSLDFSDYSENLIAACNACPQNAPYWQELLAAVAENGGSKTAYECAIAAKASGVTDENVLNAAMEIIYDFSYSGHSYTMVVTSPSGISSVCDESKWGMLDASQEEIYPVQYTYVGPAGGDNVLLITDKWAHVVDGDGVAQSVIVNDVSSSRAYGDGYLPVQNQQGVWSYIRCSDNEIIGSYESASSFANGKAFVKDNNKWELIDNELQKTGLTFEDVKLFDNGAYINNEIMVAKAGGAYSLYDEDGKNICKESFADMDVYMGGLIAYKADNGLWGYINKDGETVIEPKYEGARSFSNGLAAVKADGLWGFINEDGRIAIKPQFTYAGYFDSEYGCYVMIGAQWQKIELRNH